MKVLFLTSGPNVPSTRFRILQYIPRLMAEGHQCVVAHSWPDKYEQSPWLGFRLSRKARRWKRHVDRWRAMIGRFDVVVIERELFNDDTFDVELAFRKVAPRLVLDIDDGVFLKWPAKFEAIAGVVDHVIAGSDILAAECRKFAKAVSIVPTCVDVSRYEVKQHQRLDHTYGVPVIGWTGTSSNLQYFSLVADALMDLGRLIPFKLIIVADEAARNLMPANPVVVPEFIPWSPESETSALLRFDVGIMPLPDDDWSRFKCGFKLIQYMAAGLPTVASPVGVNSQITVPEVTGELPATTAEWVAALHEILTEVERRRVLGAAGRKRVEERYSIEANWWEWRGSVLGHWQD